MDPRGSIFGMRFNNPFVFLVQITLDVLLLPVSDNESSLGKNAASCGQYLPLDTDNAAHVSPSSSGGIASSVTDSDNCIYELERGYLLPTERTPSSVTSTFEATKRRSELHFDTGRGSIFGMRFNNPFVFLVQAIDVSSFLACALNIALNYGVHSTALQFNKRRLCIYEHPNCMDQKHLKHRLEHPVWW
ncbi:hypothetical protein HPB47_008993 [Ixodes persulcatus]|uniref:Uncharacterized protein n=1 Tax=Ixodes persulcatus TaxID=34615 RepID=A0AC60P3G4_IXOPE|nr:hypothetical protein HPB47_008993 [Ixodes persulcatus]